jgi:hypothetical protein
VAAEFEMPIAILRNSVRLQEEVGQVEAEPPETLSFYRDTPSIMVLWSVQTSLDEKANKHAGGERTVNPLRTTASAAVAVRLIQGG